MKPSSLSRLFLVRHAETDHNVLKVLRGKASAPDRISERGEAQARACGAALAALNLPDPRVYTSTYHRAQQTAQAIAGALGVKVTVLDGVHEMDTGNLNGQPYSALERPATELRHPDGTFGFVGGESVQTVGERVEAALEQVFQSGGTPVIVSHGLTLQVAVSRLLGVPFDTAWDDQRFAHQNTAITELAHEEQGWRPVQVAAAEHLRGLS